MSKTSSGRAGCGGDSPADLRTGAGREPANGTIANGPGAAGGSGQATLLADLDPGTAVGFSGERNVDATLFGSKWSAPDLTYAFPADGAAYGGGAYKSGEAAPGAFQPFNAAQKAMVRYGLDLVESYTGLTFTEIAETATRPATLRFGQTSAASVPTAEGNFPGTTPHAGDVWLGTRGQPFYRTPDIGNWGLATILHEIGHALGLKHGGDDYAALDLTAYFGTNFFAGLVPDGSGRAGTGTLAPEVNGQSWSLMTYALAPGVRGFGGEGFNQPQTYQMIDIAALQFLYGANYATRAGDTTYSFSPATGEMFVDGAGQGVPTANKILRTIWDGGGTDTIDASTYADDLVLDLQPGRHSTLAPGQRADHAALRGGGAPAAGSFALALLVDGDPRALIENATGGSGNDTLSGNVAANRLIGNAGDDALRGLDGDDLLDGGAGDDSVEGGAGDDVIRHMQAGADRYDGGAGRDRLELGAPLAAGAEIDLEAGTSRQGGLTLSWTGFEEYARIAGAGDETVRGTAGGNVLLAGAGDNLLDGRDGNDQLGGGAGSDTLLGGAGSDTLLGGDDDDLLVGGALKDAVYGGAGDDVIRIAGTDIADDVLGGAGTDTLDVSGYLGAGVRVDLAGGRYDMAGAQGTFAIREIEAVVGSARDDVITGDAGANALAGGAGDDVITGGAGADTLDGGAGTDLADYAGAGAGVLVRLDSGAGAFGEAGGDGLAGIENLRGSRFGDALIGADGIGNQLSGEAGDDYLNGLSGTDTLWGGLGRDVLIGGDGADLLAGGAGGDTLNGGAGRDVADYAGSAAGVRVWLGAGIGRGGDAAGDTFVGIEDLHGSRFDDRLVGTDGAANRLAGGAGADILDGLSGNDVLSGGAGRDSFVFGAGFGRDRVEDFADGIDLVDLVGGLGFADLTLSAVAGGVRAALAAAPATWIDLAGMRLAEIDAGDFV